MDFLDGVRRTFGFNSEERAEEAARLALEAAQVAREEERIALEKTGQILGEKEKEELLRQGVNLEELDVDGDGWITRQEYDSWVAFKEAETAMSLERSSDEARRTVETHFRRPAQQVRVPVRPLEESTVFPCGKHPEWLAFDLKLQAFKDLEANCINEGSSAEQLLVFVTEELQTQLNRCVPEEQLQEMKLASLLLDSDHFPELDPPENGPPRDLIIFVRPEPSQVDRVCKFVQHHAIRHKDSGCLYCINFVTYMDATWKKIVEQTLKPSVHNCKVRIKVREFDMGFVPLDVDILSLEMPTLLRDLKEDAMRSQLLENAAEVHGKPLQVKDDPIRRKLVSSSVSGGSCHSATQLVARALSSLEKIVKPFHQIVGKGDLTKEVISKLKAERRRSGVVCGDAGGFDKLVIVDRYVDLVGAMMTGFTYGSMILEIYGSFEVARKDMKPQDWKPGMQLNFNSNDQIWAVLRDLPMTEAHLICKQWIFAIEQVQRADSDPSSVSDNKLMLSYQAKKHWATELINQDCTRYGFNAEVTRKEVIAAHFNLLEKMIGSTQQTNLPQSRPDQQDNPMLHGDVGLLPEIDGASVNFTSFWRDYIQKAVIRNMLSASPNNPREYLQVASGGDVALRTESFKKYLQHCIERTPALVALFASQNGKQDKEALKWLTILSQCGELSTDIYDFFKERAFEFNICSDVTLHLLEKHNIIGTNTKQGLKPGSTGKPMKWIHLATTLNSSRHSVDEGKNIQSSAKAGALLKDASTVIQETYDIQSYPHIEGWLDSKQFVGSSEDTDDLEWPPPKDYETTKKEPWHRNDPKKTYEWSGHLLPPAREMYRATNDRLTPLPIRDADWTDELLARPFMLTVPPSIRIIQAALDNQLPYTDRAGRFIRDPEHYEPELRPLISSWCEALSYDSTHNPLPQMLPPPPPPAGSSYEWNMNPPPRMVFFLGGCTMAEIAAVRVLSRKQRGNANQGPIMIITTGIITGDDIIDSFDMSWEDSI